MGLLEWKAQARGGIPRRGAEIQKNVIQKIRRVFGPVQTDAGYVRISAQ